MKASVVNEEVTSKTNLVYTDLLEVFKKHGVKIASGAGMKDKEDDEKTTGVDDRGDCFGYIFGLFKAHDEGVAGTIRAEMSQQQNASLSLRTMRRLSPLLRVEVLSRLGETD